jgi:hypothetical protein
MIFGAVINRYTIQDVAEAGQMLYQKRRALAKIQEFEYKWEDDEADSSTSEEKADENL